MKRDGPLHARSGKQGVDDGRSQGKDRRLHAGAEGFIMGYVASHPSPTRKELHEGLGKLFGIEISPSGLTRCLRRLGVDLQVFRRRREPEPIWIPYAGAQLVSALAWHFGWPQATAEVIREAICRARRSKPLADLDNDPDLRGRKGRGTKSLESMDIAKVKPEILARKCLAALFLPFVTHNGEVDTVNTATGMALEAICGFRYNQATLSKFLSELKCLGVSRDLLHHQIVFWQEHHRAAFPDGEHLPLLCYYIDGDTKAFWPMMRVNRRRGPRLGRFRGCLKSVFVHDTHGRPIYLATYSGEVPMGEHILRLFEKVEESLEGPGPKLPVNRAIVMDAARNGVRTQRALASQHKYHYIANLDESLWDPRRIRVEAPPQRYRFGPATLRDCEIDLGDSRRKALVVPTRAIAIHWDRGTDAYLTTSFPADVIDASGVVRAFFDRWPDEEPPFRVMKPMACLNRVAYYGKHRIPDRDTLRPQGKGRAYRVDVEIDRIMTSFRVSLVNLYAHLSRLLGESNLSVVDLFYTVLILSGKMRDAPDERLVILEGTEKDPETMDRLAGAIESMNKMNICDDKGRRYRFALE